jgi:hypothetical protein
MEDEKTFTPGYWNSLGIDAPSGQVICNLAQVIRDQRQFSEATFGPGASTARILDHIRKELLEIEADPKDLTEWIDVVILALDGAWRQGYTPEEICEALYRKQKRNRERDWPDYRTVAQDKAVEHIRKIKEASDKAADSTLRFP